MCRTTIFRPAIVLGDSRRAETTQFDMAQAFDVLARLPVLPLRPDDRIDIVPANYVGAAIVKHSSEGSPGITGSIIFFGHGFADLSRIDGSLATRAVGESSQLLAMAGRPIFRHGELAGVQGRRDWLRSIAAESVLAVPGLEYGV